MSDLDGQRAKRTGSRDRIDRIKDEMDREVLRDRIIRALLSIRCDMEEPCEDCRILACQDADAVIRELNLGIPCACRMRKIAIRSAEKLGITEVDDSG